MVVKSASLCKKSDANFCDILEPTNEFNVSRCMYVCVLLLLVFSPWAGLAETRVQSGDWYGSGTLHPGQVLRGSLPLLSPAF